MQTITYYWARCQRADLNYQNNNHLNNKTMNDIFNLHLDPSGHTGGPMSSRHMNRDQARQVIRENIINNCILHRNDEGFGEAIPHYIADIEESLDHKIPFYVSVDDIFENNMGFIGASYWFREFRHCITFLDKFGTEATPSKTDSIIRVSMVLMSERYDEVYHILWDEDYCKYFAPNVYAQNTLLIDELDKNHNMLGALVDGYMWAQGIEKQVVLECNNSIEEAAVYLSMESIEKYGKFLYKCETKILDGDFVAMKPVKDPWCTL